MNQYLSLTSINPLNSPSQATENLPESTIKHISKYTALIVEPREHFALKFVLSNILNNLDSDWSIVILHGNKNVNYLDNVIEDITNTTVNVKERIQRLNLGVDNLKQMEYSDLFFDPRFYDYIPTEMFLIFQTDSMIIPENKDRIYEYMEYDYVGAPWPDTNYVTPLQVGNGGFSLRRKSKMLELLSHSDAEYLKHKNISRAVNHYVEDIFFSGIYHEGIQVNKPSYQKASEFSIESVYSKNPFAVHAVWKYPPAYYPVLNDYPFIRELADLN